MRKAFEIGGFIAAAVLIAFGVVAIVMGVNGRQTVNSSLSHEYIVAGADMTPSAIKAEAQKAGIASAVKQWPTMDIAGKTIDTGPEAQAMAQYMHIHALEATGGYTYAQMGIYPAKPGTPQVPAGGRAAVPATLSSPRSIRRRSSRCRTAPGRSGSARPRSRAH